MQWVTNCSFSVFFFIFPDCATPVYVVKQYSFLVVLYVLFLTFRALLFAFIIDGILSVLSCIDRILPC